MKDIINLKLKIKTLVAENERLKEVIKNLQTKNGRLQYELDNFEEAEPFDKLAETIHFPSTKKEG